MPRKEAKTKPSQCRQFYIWSLADKNVSILWLSVNAGQSILIRDINQPFLSLLSWFSLLSF